MTTKLTLTVDQKTIALAKAYAAKNGQSLSEIVQNYLKVLVQKDNSKTNLSPGVRSLLGSINVSPDFDYKKVLQDELIKKHSK